MLSFLLALGAAYLIGSVPTGFWVGKAIKGVDIRQLGSGNVGASNVFRTVGKGWGVAVLL
ncbi:MAG: glycerol-3-phosphate acyltransferase, partial [Candidatus Omnitrophica bacterium]|nr:glycerol-3-phosphate acyltransferase [Candidatus Omnitrophota bacterium]